MPCTRLDATPALALLGALALALCLAACENEVDTSENLLPVADAGGGGGDAAGLPEDASQTGGCDCLQVGDWFRFDTLGVESLDGKPHPIIQTLNGLWATDIAGNELNFYFMIKELPPGEVVFRVVNGARVVDGEEVCLKLSTEVEFRMARDGCELGPSEPGSINVYAGTPAHPKNCTFDIPDIEHAIPVRGAVLTSTLNADCSRTDNGLVVDAIIARAALEQTCTCLLLTGGSAEDCGVPDASYDPEPDVSGNVCKGCNPNFQNLMTLLQAFGTLDYACKTPDGADAVCLEAFFSAERIAEGPPDCVE